MNKLLLSERAKEVSRRITPHERGGSSPAACDHLARYIFAADYVEGARILDIGMGTGYGGACMSQVSNFTVELDLDESAVRAASRAYPCLGFLVADAGSLPFQSRVFDLVTCFEVIEHVADPELIIADASRVIRHDGLLLISTPNAEVGPMRVRRATGCPDHVRELSRAEFETVLKRYFKDVAVLGQRWEHLGPAQFLRWCWLLLVPIAIRELLRPVTNRIRHLLFLDLDPAGLAESVLRASNHWPAPCSDERSRPVTLFACCRVGPENDLSLGTEACNSVNNRI